MIFVVSICCVFLVFTFLKKRRQERELLLVKAREKRREKIEFFCQRAREIPNEKIGRYQVWWAKTHETDVVLKEYYIY